MNFKSILKPFAHVVHIYLYCDTGEKWNCGDDMVDYKSFEEFIFHQQASPYVFIYIIHKHLKKSQIGALMLKTNNEVRAYPMPYSPLSYSSP